MTVSGNVGTSDVVMDGLADISGQPVVSNAQGYYEAKVQYNSTLAVMPMKEGHPSGVPLQLTGTGSPMAGLTRLRWRLSTPS